MITITSISLRQSVLSPSKSPVVTVRITIRYNIQKFYVLPTQYSYVFCVDLRTNSDYFPIRP